MAHGLRAAMASAGWTCRLSLSCDSIAEDTFHARTCASVARWEACSSHLSSELLRYQGLASAQSLVKESSQRIRSKKFCAKGLAFGPSFGFLFSSEAALAAAESFPDNAGTDSAVDSSGSTDLLFISFGLLFAFWVSNYLAPFLIFRGIINSKEEDDVLEALQSDVGTERPSIKRDTDRSKGAALGFGNKRNGNEAQTPK